MSKQKNVVKHLITGGAVPLPSAGCAAFGLEGPLPPPPDSRGRKSASYSPKTRQFPSGTWVASRADLPSRLFTPGLGFSLVLFPGSLPGSLFAGRSGPSSGAGFPLCSLAECVYFSWCGFLWGLGFPAHEIVSSQTGLPPPFLLRRRLPPSWPSTPTSMCSAGAGAARAPCSLPVLLSGRCLRGWFPSSTAC